MSDIDYGLACEFWDVLGRPLQMRGERLLATFDGPARAVRAGVALADFAKRLGLNVHVGVAESGDDRLAGNPPEQVPRDAIGQGVEFGIGDRLAHRAPLARRHVDGDAIGMTGGAGAQEGKQRPSGGRLRSIA